MVTSAEGLQEQLREMALANGATYFGLADLRPVVQYVTRQGGDFLAEYPVGISAGIALADGVVDQLHQHLSGDVANLYCHHIYTVVAEQLDRLAAGLAFYLEREGYRAIPVPQGRPYSGTKLVGLISHKLVAHLAGLGWIGKNCLLLTKAHGPRVRWVSVLTDAPLETFARDTDDRDPCKECTQCVDFCPARAILGVPFDPADPRDARFDAERCRQYRREREELYGARVCGLCVYVCPHGYSLKRKKRASAVSPRLLRQQLGETVAAITAGLEAKPADAGSGPGQASDY